jgi:tripartite-type tricarboxylate transporter receptor subunit TctC
MRDVRKGLTEQGADVQGGTPEDFGAFMRNESARWGAVVKQAGIRAE